MTASYPIALDYVLACGMFRFFPPMEACDATGRPLLEGRSLRWPPAPSDYRPCRYTGRRNGHANPMNVAALRQFLAHKDSASAWLSALSHVRLAQVGHGNRALHILRTAHAAYHAPKAWLLAKQFDACLAPPPGIAGAAKIAHGLYEGTLGFLQRHGLSAARKLTAADLAHDAEISGQLIGRKEVCAAPAEMIEAVIGLILDPPEGTPPTKAGPSAREVTELAQLLWLTETIAHANAYAALTSHLPYGPAARGKTDLLPHIRVTFPNALEPVLAVMHSHAPNSGLLHAYCIAQTEDTLADATVHSALAVARSVLSLPPEASEIRTMARRLRRQSVTAIGALDAQLATMPRFTQASIQVDASQLDLFFGPLATPEPVRSLKRIDEGLR